MVVKGGNVNLVLLRTIPKFLVVKYAGTKKLKAKHKRKLNSKKEVILNVMLADPSYNL